MDNYIICIPSYKRSQICNEQTLSTLKKHKIPASKIHVYVANQEEYDEYEKILDKTLFNTLVIGKKGLVQQRRFIMSHWPENKQIVFMDDDVKSIDLKMAKYKSLDAFIKDAYKECKSQGAFIWGVYPVFNPFFRKTKPTITTCLNYIVGAFYGIINRPKLKSLELTLTAENGQKEDVERTIRYFLTDGIVLRFNKVGFETKYYGKEGGLGTFEDRLKPMKEASQRLLKQYSEYGYIATKPNGMTEFRLRKIPARTENNLQNEKKTKKRRTLKNKTQKKRYILF
jgi:hypothetical protein